MHSFVTFLLISLLLNINTPILTYLISPSRKKAQEGSLLINKITSVCVSVSKNANLKLVHVGT